MSMPPDGGWRPSPQQGQPYGQPYDPAAAHPEQQPPPAGWQQGSWRQHPAPPSPKGGGVKWLLVAIVVPLVIGVTIGATMLFTRDEADGPGPVKVRTDESFDSGLVHVQPAEWGDCAAVQMPGESLILLHCDSDLLT